MTNVVEFPDRSTIAQQAAAWLIRLDGEEPLTPHERRELEQWMASSPAHRERLVGMAELWGSMNVLTELAVPLDRYERRPRISRYRRPLQGIAAAIVVAVAAAVLFTRGEDSVTESNGFHATAVGQQQRVELADGSVVLLNTDSQIRVDYGSEFRDVNLLRGQAHFTVAANPERPFRVFAGKGRIRAVGTAFSVYVRGDAVDVTVSEGTVALEAVEPAVAVPGAGFDPRDAYREAPVKALGTLTAGQFATISGRTASETGQTATLHEVASIENSEMSRRLAWTEGMLLFTGEPLEEVVREISRYTMVSIEIPDPDVAAIRIGGRFPVGETDAMFETLEDTFGLRVTYLSDDHVVLSAGD